MIDGIYAVIKPIVPFKDSNCKEILLCKIIHNPQQYVVLKNLCVAQDSSIESLSKEIYANKMLSDSEYTLKMKHHVISDEHLLKSN